eukprot:1328638-Amphidinium_carterae.1
MRKLTSKCLDYGKDYPLNCLLYDMAMASTISAVVSIAAQQKVAPEQIASNMDMFQAYWHQQVRKMEDMCRQEMDARRPLEQSLPNIFFTLAPAELKYVLHEGMFQDSPDQEETLTEQQWKLTMHMHNTMEALLEAHLLKNGAHLHGLGIQTIRQ